MFIILNTFVDHGVDKYKMKHIFVCAGLFTRKGTQIIHFCKCLCKILWMLPILKG